MAKITNFFAQVFGHELLMTAMKTIFDAGAKSAVKALESNLLGFGVNDESLFLSACAYAHLRLNVTKDKLNLIFEAMNLLEKGPRRKVVRTIGKGEQEVIVPLPVLKDDGSIALDKKGNPIIKDVKRVLNVRGGETIAMIAALDNLNDIKAALEASAATITAGQDIQDVWEKIKTNILEPALDRSRDFVNDAKALAVDLNDRYTNAMVPQDTGLHRLIRKFDIFGFTR